MNERFDQLASVKLVVPVRVVHLEVVKLQLLLRHVAGVNGHFHVVLHVSKAKRMKYFVLLQKANSAKVAHSRSCAMSL